MNISVLLINDVNTLLKRSTCRNVCLRQVLNTGTTGTVSVDFDVYCPWDVMNYLRDLQI